jgi:hypothetical protein
MFMRTLPKHREPFRFGNELWNVFVPKYAPQYDGLWDLIRKGRPHEFCGTSEGVWVPFGWLMTVWEKKKKGFGFRRVNRVAAE